MLADRRKDIDEVFQVGDLYDFEAVSHFAKGTIYEDGKRFQKELDKSAAALTDIHDAWPFLKVRIRGNHEDRLDAYLAGTAKGLAGLRIFDFDALTNAVEHGWVTEDQPYELAPRTHAVHGLTLRSRSGYTAHAHLDRMSGNVVHGHTHRAGLVYRTTSFPDETRWGMEIGCLMDRRKAQYLEAGIADWQLAFGALWIDGKDVQPELIHVQPNGSFIFDGKRYTP